MNTLYIHGLDSSPRPDKLAVIRTWSEVEGLHLDYRHQPDSFNVLSSVIVENKISHIVGSSMGGYLGYWLAKRHGIPALLFNPALNMNSIGLNVDVKGSEIPELVIVTGMLDDVVDPVDTAKFLKQQQAHEHILLLKCEELGHQIDMDTFQKFVDFFYSSFGTVLA